MSVNEVFQNFATGCARFTGRPAMLVVSVLLALGGAASYFWASEKVLAGANIAISIVTLLLLPILQATQNRDGAALQAKMDELIKIHTDARDQLIGLERKGEKEIERVRPDGEAPCDPK